MQASSWTKFLYLLTIGVVLISAAGCDTIVAGEMHDQNVRDLQAKRLTPEEFHQREAEIRRNLPRG